MGLFSFFTDPALLNAQTAAQAFGPVTTAPVGSDHFAVTDLHTSTTAAPVYALCDGLVCAQRDDEGTLTLILKPSQQPAFDFPAVSYFLYKGVDPASILTSDGTSIETSYAGANRLVAAVKAAWELPANQNPSTPPPKACLGLHLNPTDYPVAADQARFADDEALDNLFYEGDPAIQLPRVRSGFHLGDFSTSAPFGLEILVERIGHRPKIGTARKRSNVIAVPSLPAGADATTEFLHWDAKEAVLGFIDPCAFWGSFFSTGLRRWDGSTNAFVTVPGAAVHGEILAGPAGSFANRHKAYIDIRNEHGCSVNYYRGDGPDVQLTLDPAADIDAALVDYYGNGWPSFTVDDNHLPAGTVGDRVDVRFALPKTLNTLPLIYITTGFRDGLTRPKDPQRFLQPARRADTNYLEETSVTVPLVDDAGTTRMTSSYSKLYCFKRPLIIEDQPNPAASPTDLSPSYNSDLDHFMPLLEPAQIPTTGGTTKLKTFDELFFVGASVGGGLGFVANAALGMDADNVVLLLVPRAHLTPLDTNRPAALAFPSMAFPEGATSLFTYIGSLLPSALLMREVPDPQSPSTQMELLYYKAGCATAETADQLRPAVLISMSTTEMTQLQTILSSSAAGSRPSMLSIAFGSSHIGGSHPFTGMTVTVSTLSGQAIPSRVEHPTSIRLYADAS